MYLQIYDATAGKELSCSNMYRSPNGDIKESCLPLVIALSISFMMFGISSFEKLTDEQKDDIPNEFSMSNGQYTRLLSFRAKTAKRRFM